LSLSSGKVGGGGLTGGGVVNDDLVGDFDEALAYFLLEAEGGKAGVPKGFAFFGLVEDSWWYESSDILQITEEGLRAYRGIS